MTAATKRQAGWVQAHIDGEDEGARSAAVAEKDYMLWRDWHGGPPPPFTGDVKYSEGHLTISMRRVPEHLVAKLQSIIELDGFSSFGYHKHGMLTIVDAQTYDAAQRAVREVPDGWIPKADPSELRARQPWYQRALLAWFPIQRECGSVTVCSVPQDAICTFNECVEPLLTAKGYKVDAPNNKLMKAKGLIVADVTVSIQQDAYIKRGCLLYTFAELAARRDP
jgi:hypothetical protein